MLKYKQVRKYALPKYPDKVSFINNGYSLNMLPERWKGKNCAALALSAVLLLSATSCSSSELKTSQTNQKAKSLIPPLFEHGDGKCVSGGVAGYSAFITEDEAFKIIRDEFKKKNIIIEKNKLTIKDIELPSTNLLDSSNITETFTGDLELDGYNQDHGIGFEFVSYKDYREWCKELNPSTVDRYDFFATAKLLQKSLEKKVKDKSIAVFYDPTTDNSGTYGKDDAYELLRQQVQDFISWIETNMIVTD